jgi:hypothetical protein
MKPINLLVAATAFTITLGLASLCHTNAQESGSTVEPTNPTVPVQAVPTIRKGNKYLKPNQLKRLEEETDCAVGRGKIKNRKLSDWKTFAKEKFNPGENLYGIDPDRQIFQVESAQDQVEVKSGIIYKNATVNQAIDAETGDLLYVTVTAPIPGVTPNSPSN